MKFELQVAKKACETLLVDLVATSNGVEVSRKRLDMSGNATSTVYFGAALVVKALNEMESLGIGLPVG